VARPAAKLVDAGGVVGFRALERFERGQLHIFGLDGVIGSVAAMADGDAGGGDDLLGRLVALHRGEGRGLGLGVIVSGQAFALLHVENRVALQKRIWRSVVSPQSAVSSDRAAGIDGKLARLALADMPAKFKRLAGGKPHGRGVALRACGNPEHEHVDALIGDAAMA